MKTLIIGYGNQSRRDNGVGWFVIEQLAALNLPDVKLETAHQLEVETAETISRSMRSFSWTPPFPKRRKPSSVPW